MGAYHPAAATDARPLLLLQLQFSRRAASTEDLTKSFGWDSSGSHMQEDVHEFNKILCGRRCPRPCPARRPPFTPRLPLAVAPGAPGQPRSCRCPAGDTLEKKMKVSHVHTRSSGELEIWFMWQGAGGPPGLCGARDCGMCACACVWEGRRRGGYPDRLPESICSAAQGTKVCGLTDKIFSGHILKFIQCINVDFKSEKKDMFQDIMVDVKGCANVYESFDRITAEDKFEGENQYECEGHGKQVLSPPPVLLLHPTAVVPTLLQQWHSSRQRRELRSTSIAEAALPEDVPFEFCLCVDQASLDMGLLS